MNASTTISEIEGRPALVVLAGGWKSEYRDVIRSKQLEVLSIRVQGDDLAFLQGMRDLRGLVLNTWDVSDLRVLQELEQLEILTLNTPPKPSVALDFAAFPRLRSLSVYWNPGFDSLFVCRSLERLFVFGPPDPNLERFGVLGSLRRLELSGGRKLKNIRGIESLSALGFLGLYSQGGLRALTGMGDLLGLRELAFDGCRHVDALDEIGQLANLKYLKLADCGPVASLQPLAGLGNLEDFFAWESTNVIDGDLSVLTQLPRLRQIAMMSRRHYRPSVHEVEVILAGRSKSNG